MPGAAIKAVQALCLAGALATLLRPHSIQPWWLPVLVAVTAAVVLLGFRREWEAGSQVAVLVGSVTAAAYGAVGAKHWRPVIGFGWPYEGSIESYERVALAGAMLAGVAGLLALVRLRQLGVLAIERPRLRHGLAVGGALAALVVLMTAAGSPDDRDLRSLLAFGLLYGVPWGGAVVLAALLPARLAVVALGSAAVVAALTVTDTMEQLGRSPFSQVAAALALVTLVAWLALRQQGQRGPEVGDLELPVEPGEHL
ncbi:hypothetical protein [Nocardioides houyundeii]|uniref:hypothetical protein n=1 Tax=Nocardioides houyundeii TaxID=2045452 RepID=UPI000DF35C1B|nr:hypothetical protein [Nocardioides houyundeii]